MFITPHSAMRHVIINISGNEDEDIFLYFLVHILHQMYSPVSVLCNCRVAILLPYQSSQAINEHNKSFTHYILDSAIYSSSSNESTKCFRCNVEIKLIIKSNLKQTFHICNYIYIFYTLCPLLYAYYLKECY